MINKPAGIYFDHLSLGYGSKTVIKDITGFLPKGIMTAIIGPNGGGKTTVFKALMSIIKPLAGSLWFNGLEAKSIAYLAQNQNIDVTFPLSVFDVVSMGYLNHQGSYGSLTSLDRQEIMEALDTVGLASYATATLSQLSGGQVQRAFFARLSLQKASLILLDEPFAAVDPYTLDELLDCLYCWQKKGATIVMISHDLDVVKSHFSESLLLAKEVIAWGKTTDVLTADNVNRAKKTFA